MIGLWPLASGSKGNALYLGTKRAKLLFDAGLSAKAIQMRLAEIGVRLEEIDAIVVSHEHTDHVSGLPTLTGKFGIPIFANRDTAEAIFVQLEIQPTCTLFFTGEAFSFKDVEIFPFNVRHDAVDPVGFTISYEGLKIGICTDLGIATTSIAKHLAQCDYLLLEANHDVNMVYASSRPAVYIERVLSRQGHLSNPESATLLKEVWHTGLKHIFLAHLSSECNTPEIALETVRKVLPSDITTRISIAHQQERSAMIAF